MAEKKMNQPKPLIPDYVENKTPPSKPLSKSELDKMRKKLNIPDGSLIDHIIVLLVNSPDKIEYVGKAVMKYSDKYSGTLKYVLYGVGLGIEYLGKIIDKKIMRANEIRK